MAQQKWNRSNADKLLAYHRKWRAEHRDKVHEYQRRYSDKHAMKRQESSRAHGRKKNGFSGELIRQLLVEQDHQCAICRSPLTAGFHADHDHSMNHPRGLLCQDCNHGLGRFKDSPTILESAIVYLKKYALQGVK
jgi:hypothetical protein